jgi:hypothetical protein
LAGNSTIFTAVSAGVPSPTLQWQISTNSGGTWSNLADGGNISGATTGSLTISNTTLAQSGEEFQVVATNVAGNATSTAAVMTVSLEPVAPAITTPPANTTVNTGENAIFTAVASGTPTPGLQWQISTDSGGNWTNLSDGGNVSGSATGTLTFGNVAFDQSGDEFRVVANSTAGNATSSAATVTVFVPPSFSTAPANTTVLVGGNATFTAAASGVPTPTVQWQISTDGGGNWTNLNDGANISGSGTNTLTVSNATLAESGDEFQLVATSNAGNAISGAATLTVALAPAISTQPGNTTAIAGDNATFTAAASGTPAPSLQWQVSAGGVDPWINLSDDANISGSTTGTLTLSNLTVSQSGQDFRLVAANPGGNATSNAATLTVAAKVAPGVKSAPSSQTVTAGAKASFTASFTGTPAPTLQWQFSTNAGKSWTNLANGGAYSGVTTGTLSVSGTTTAMSGTQFRLMATNSAGTLDSAAVTLTVNAPVVAPKITTQPKALSVKKGAKATFTVKASGTAPLTYQWMFNKKSLKNGGGISGATTVTLTISKAATSNGGAYTVKVTNKAGSVTSASVKLTVKS